MSNHLKDKNMISFSTRILKSLLTIILAVCLFPLSALADGGPDSAWYRWEEVSWEAPPRISGTNRLDLGSDQITAPIPLGFTFRYYGVDYDETYVSSNGFVTFLAGQNSVVSVDENLPSTASPNATIAGYSADLNLPNGGNIWYATIGTAPFRKFVVEFENVEHNAWLFARDVDFQIILEETTNDIYIAEFDSQNRIFYNSIVGFENQDGTSG